MNFINFTVIKLSICLVIGIVLAHFYTGSFFFGFWGIIISVVLFFIAWWLAKKQFTQNIFFGIISYCSFIVLGSLLYQIQLPQFQENHYSHYIKEENNQKFQIKIIEILKPDMYNSKYLAKTISITNLKTKGIILVNIKKDSTSKPLLIDDLLLVSATFLKIPKPLNPYQFDYSSYMKKLGAYHQIKINNNQILQKVNGPISVKGKSEFLRSYIIEKLKKSPIKKEERAIIQALILGQRRDISKKLYKEYAAAGAIHILAVSGLHVGVFYFLLGFLLKPIEGLKNGKIITSILIVIFLWIFATIAGLSPSVVRAVTMFSFFAFAKLIQRETSTINTLFNSFFILLLIKPMWLFHVGFQLSYLAVFFILWMQPKLYLYYKPRFYIDKLLWSIITVTIAAQIGIIPLSIFYFHQLPGLSLITNLVVLPFLSILLGVGILVILLTVLNILPLWLANSYNFLIETLNNFIGWIASHDDFIYQNIHYSTKKMVATYVLFIAFVLLWKKTNFQRLVFSLLSVSILISTFIIDMYKTSTNELVVFYKNRHTLIASKENNKLLLFRSDSATKYKDNFPIKGYLTSQNIEIVSEEKLPKLIKYNNETILILDSLGVYPKTSKVDIVLLTYSPKMNLERLINNVKPKYIIADGNNYKSYIKRWETTCKSKQVPFYYTGKTGAYIIK